MAKLIVPRGPLGLRAQRRVESESRVVSCVASVKVAADVSYAVTRMVSQNVRLLSVRVGFYAKDANLLDQTLFRVLTGFGKPGSAAEILAWERIFPLVSTGFTDEPWVRTAGVNSFEWSLSQVFKGTSRRFGFWIQAGPVGADQMWCSFEIIEE